MSRASGIQAYHKSYTLGNTTTIVNVTCGFYCNRFTGMVEPFVECR